MVSGILLSKGLCNFFCGIYKPQIIVLGPEFSIKHSHSKFYARVEAPLSLQKKRRRSLQDNYVLVIKIIFVKFKGWCFKIKIYLENISYNLSLWSKDYPPNVIVLYTKIWRSYSNHRSLNAVSFLINLSILNYVQRATQ